MIIYWNNLTEARLNSGYYEWYTRSAAEPPVSIVQFQLDDIIYWKTNTKAHVTGNASWFVSYPASGYITGAGVEGTVFGDSVEATLALQASVTDGVTLSDTPIATHMYLRAEVADGFDTTDAMIYLSATLGEAIDEVVFTDTSSAIIRMGVTVADGVSLADISSALAHWTLSATDGAVFADTPDETGVVAAGILSITVTASSGSFTVTQKAPGISVS